jgi:hypothetical protein
VKDNSVTPVTPAEHVHPSNSHSTDDVEVAVADVSNGGISRLQAKGLGEEGLDEIRLEVAESSANGDGI